MPKLPDCHKPVAHNKCLRELRRAYFEKGKVEHWWCYPCKEVVLKDEVVLCKKKKLVAKGRKDG